MSIRNLSYLELLNPFNIVLTVHLSSGFADSSKFFSLGTFIIRLMVFGGEYTALVFHLAFVYQIKSGVGLFVSVFFFLMSFQQLSMSVLDSILLL